jgi:hypothetical protein
MVAPGMYADSFGIGDQTSRTHSRHRFTDYDAAPRLHLIH